jgi:hypothetical protein
MGIAEANLVEHRRRAGAGRQVPFCCSFACFITGLRHRAHLGRLLEGNVRVVGSHSGIAIGDDGYSTGPGGHRAMRTLRGWSSSSRRTTWRPGGGGYLCRHVPSSHHQKLERMNDPATYKFRTGKAVERSRRHRRGHLRHRRRGGFASGGPGIKQEASPSAW